MGAVWLCARAGLRRRLRPTLALALLLGLTGAVTVAAAAASRRAQTSFERLLVATSTANVQVDLDGPLPAGTMEAIGSVEGVRSATLAAFVAVAPAGRGLLPFRDTIAFAALDRVGPGTFEGLMLEGRPLNRANRAEVVVNRAMADLLGVGVGDRLDLDSLSRESGLRMVESGDVTAPDGPRIAARVVGIAQAAEDVSDTPDPYLVVTPALLENGEVFGLPGLVGVQAAPERLDDVAAALRRLVPGARVTPVEDLGQRVSGGIDVQAAALVVFALAAGIAGATAVGQGVVRTTVASAAEDRHCGTLGMTRPQRLLVAVLWNGPVALGGAALAVAGGILGAPLAVTGLARQAEPDRGTWVDWPMIVLGVAAAMAVVVVATLLATRRDLDAQPWVGTSTADRFLLRAGVPLVIALGVRRAVGRESRSWSGRSALVASVAGVAALAGVLTFSRSVDVLFLSPQRWGATFDAIIQPPEDEAAFTEALSDLHDDGAVEAVAIVTESSLALRRADGSAFRASLASAQSTKGVLDPWLVVQGQPLQSAGHALVGKAVLEATGLKVGDRLSVETDDGDRSLVIRGRMVAYGEDQIDDGVAVTPRVAAELGDDDGAVLAVRFNPETDVAVETRRLEERHDIGGIPPPGSIDNLDEVGLMPVALAGFIAVLGLFAGGHAVTISLRRSRKQIATLHALGATRSQLRRTVIFHALTLVGIGALLGVPVGISIGRSVYVAVAEAVGAIARSTVPMRSIALFTFVVGAVAVSLAGIPGHRLTPVRQIDALRSE